MIKVGCCGFPIARSRYSRDFPVVEIAGTFLRLPKWRTLRRWREEIPPPFEFTLRAWRRITHPSDGERPGLGYFRGTPEVWDAWLELSQAASLLQSRLIIFQTPAGFYPHADHLRNMYDFFKRVDRSRFIFVWEPEGKSWNPRLVGKICRDLNLVCGIDPSQTQPLPGPIQYFRLPGKAALRRAAGRRFSGPELERLADACRAGDVYVLFDQEFSLENAARFQEIVSKRL